MSRYEIDPKYCPELPIRKLSVIGERDYMEEITLFANDLDKEASVTIKDADWIEREANRASAVLARDLAFTADELKPHVLREMMEMYWRTWTSGYGNDV